MQHVYCTVVVYVRPDQRQLWPCYNSDLSAHQRHILKYRTYTATLRYACFTQTDNSRYLLYDDYSLISRTKTNRRTAREQYIGKTGRNLSTRLTEHKRATRNGDVNNHIAEHHLQTKHQIDWDSATCITYSTDYYQRLSLESWFTELEQTPLNSSQR